MFPLFSSIEQTYYSITTNVCGSLKHACVWLGLCVHFLSFKIREIQFVPLKVWINSRVKNASSKRWLEHQSKHICACGKHPGGYWPDLYGCWLGLSHSTLRKGTSDEKKKKKNPPQSHPFLKKLSFIYILKMSDWFTKHRKHKVKAFVHRNPPWASVLNDEDKRWNGYIFSPLSAKIYWKRQIHKQIIKLSALRIREYSEVKPKGREDWGVYGYICVCTCVLLFFPITGISFKKPRESAIKQRSSEYASGNITQGWGLHCTAIE